MHESSLIASLQHAARVAGERLLEGYQSVGAIDFETKGASDFVTHYDRAAERIIIDSLQRAHSGLAFLGEAGCTVSDLAGDPTPDEWASLLVAHPERHDELLEMLAAPR